jgi:membrane protein YdbS with pleckstrin-like domain
MHRFPSNSVIARFKVTAFLLCFFFLMIPVVAGTLAYSILTDDTGLTKIAVALLALTVLIAVLQFLLAGRTRCPLCMTPVLASKRCAKHRHARTLLGSHRLRVAVAILFRNSFKCPYCHESAAMEVRTRRSGSGSRHY